MIRKLLPEDEALFLAMSEEFYNSPAVEHPVPHSYHTRAFAELMHSDVYLEGFLLCDGDAPAGYALLQKTYSREAGGMCIWIDEIYVRPAFRGRGLARELFSRAAQMGAARLRLEVEPENSGAIALYERLGYRPLAYRSMAKDLP